MWVVAAIVIVAFTFFYDAGKVQNRQDTEVMFEIGDESYTQQDWNTALGPLYGQFIFRMGSDYIDLFQQLTSERASTSDSRSMSKRLFTISCYSERGLRITKFIFPMMTS